MPYSFSFEPDTDVLDEGRESSKRMLVETLGLANGRLVTASFGDASFGDRENLFLELNFIGPSYRFQPLPFGEPSLSQLTNGNVLLVWETEVDGAFKLLGQLAGETGTLVGGSFELAFEGAHASPWLPEAAALEDGGFVLVTTQNGTVFWNRYDAAGVETGAFGDVSSPSSRPAGNADVAGLADGGFAVVYQSGTVGDANVEIAVYNADGSTRLAHTPVRAGADEQTAPEIVALPNGGFAIAYADAGLPFPGGGLDRSGIVLKIYDADGDVVNTVRASSTNVAVTEANPDIAVTPEGFIMVAWERPGAGNWGRIFDQAGATIAMDDDGGEFRISGDGSNISISGRPGGSFAVAFDTPNGGQIIDFDIVRVARGTDAKDDLSGENIDERIECLGGDDIVLAFDGEDTVNGGDGADRLRGGLGNDSIDGGDDDDVIFGDSGFDSLKGGDGNDTIYGGDGPEGLVFNQLFGEAGADSLIGGGARDVLNGGLGRDALQGRDGDDTYILDSVTRVGLGVFSFAYDVVVEAENGGEDDRVVITALAGKERVREYTLGDNVENCDLRGVENFDANGNALDNFISGNGGDNVLSGLGGDDFIRSFDEGSDLLRGGKGSDTLHGANAVLKAAAAGEGVTTLQGGSGNDFYLIDGPSDIVVEDADNGIDQVTAYGDYALTASVENLVLEFSADRGTGNGRDNTITSTGDKADTLNGASGADTMIGGDGDDRYIVDNVGDVVKEEEDQGYDVVEATVDYAIPGFVEEVILVGGRSINATGGGGGERIVGNSGDNRIDGGLGADTLEGGGGRDAFVFGSALGLENLDEIVDFSRKDDLILLERDVFGLKLGDLRDAVFTVGEKAADGSDRIVYHKDSGALLFDPDGKDGEAAIRFATLKSGLKLDAGDFEVI